MAPGERRVLLVRRPPLPRRFRHLPVCAVGTNLLPRLVSINRGHSRVQPDITGGSRQDEEQNAREDRVRKVRAGISTGNSEPKAHCRIEHRECAENNDSPCLACNTTASPLLKHRDPPFGLWWLLYRWLLNLIEACFHSLRPFYFCSSSACLTAIRRHRQPHRIRSFRLDVSRTCRQPPSRGYSPLNAEGWG